MEKCLSCLPVRCPRIKRKRDECKQKTDKIRKVKKTVVVTSVVVSLPKELHPGVGHFMLKL